MLWCVVCGVWCVVCGVWCVVYEAFSPHTPHPTPHTPQGLLLFIRRGEIARELPPGVAIFRRRQRSPCAARIVRIACRARIVAHAARPGQRAPIARARQRLLRSRVVALRQPGVFLDELTPLLDGEPGFIESLLIDCLFE